MLKLNVFKSACIPAPPDLNTSYVKAKPLATASSRLEISI